MLNNNIFSAGILAAAYMSTAVAFGQSLQEVDLELVLAADASGSVSPDLSKAQRDGFATAFRNESLQHALLSGPTGKVAVVYFEWAGLDRQHSVVPWTLLETAEDAAMFAAFLEDAPIAPVGGETSISGAMLYADILIRDNPYDGLRKVLDLAGNGPNSDGPSVSVGRKALSVNGVVVNGLVLPNQHLDNSGPYDTLFKGYDGNIDTYFKREVISGPGSFVMIVEAESDFAEAILRKLVLEVAWMH